MLQRSPTTAPGSTCANAHTRVPAPTSSLSHTPSGCTNTPAGRRAVSGRAGTPAHTSSSGTSVVTTEPMPTSAARSDGEVLADLGARADVGLGADRRAAHDEHARAERREVADAVVVGEHGVRHGEDVPADLDIGGGDDAREQHGARADARRRRDRRRRVHDRCVAVVVDVESRSQPPPAGAGDAGSRPRGRTARR